MRTRLLQLPPNAVNPVLTAADVTDMKVDALAHPFLVIKDKLRRFGEMAHMCFPELTQAACDNQRGPRGGEER